VKSHSIDVDGSADHSISLHTGQSIPTMLIESVANWNPTELTSGWLQGLPSTVAELCAQWEITLEPGIPESAITLVLLGHSQVLGPVVIKSSPLADEFESEVTALQLAAGENVARLFDVDLARSVMVIERIVPGTQLRQVEMSDDAATRLAAESVSTFWRPVADPDGLHPLRRWMRALLDDPPVDRVDMGLIRHAQEIALELLADSSKDCLLHGDFQHHNLLLRESGEWAIIDPKGVYGNPGFEIAAWMYNPPGVTMRDDYLELVRRRVEIFAEVWEIDRQELIAWAFVGAVLSVCWSVADAMPEDWSFQFDRGAKLLRTLVT
jgi:streptomycin 6-kinase